MTSFFFKFSSLLLSFYLLSLRTSQQQLQARHFDLFSRQSPQRQSPTPQSTWTLRPHRVLDAQTRFWTTTRTTLPGPLPLPDPFSRTLSTPLLSSQPNPTQPNHLSLPSFSPPPVEANDNFQRQFSPSCNFSKCRLKIRRFCPQPCPEVFYFLKALVSLSHVYRGWWASFSAQCCCRGWSFSAHFWNLFLCLLCRYSNDQNRCRCRVQTSFLRVDGWCCINMHVPTSFCCCEIQPVVIGDEKCHRVFL